MRSSMSLPMAVAVLATTVGAFVPAQPRCVIAPREAGSNCRTDAARVVQRPRKIPSSIFAAGEPEASAESPAAIDAPADVPDDDASTSASDEEEAAKPPMTEEERARMERLQEIERLRAKEKFITAPTGVYECDQCGFLYNPAEVVRGALPGTKFDDLPSTWLCPVCNAPKSTFVAQMKTIAGFEDNLQYGLGANTLTGGQKNLLIFGALAAFFVLFLLGYALE